MNRNRIIAVLAFCLAFTLACAQMPAALTVTEETIGKVQASREALFDARRISVPQLSVDIGGVVRDVVRLDREGKYQAALERLQTLQKYGPLLEIPSLEVHILASLLYAKLGQADSSLQHQLYASAHIKLLRERSGTGRSADDPLRVTMQNELYEWVRLRRLNVTNVRSNTYSGRELLVLTYQESTADTPAQQLFVEVDPRTRIQANASFDRYSAIPIAQLPARSLELLHLARAKREQFLNDTKFPYLELRGQLDDILKKSTELHKSGKLAEAVAALREIERIRPIEDIPTPRLLIWYSFLMGQTGNTEKQTEMRGLIFGVQQAIAHSGDGRTPETAIHVLFIEEEYDWLAEKKLKLKRQALRDIGAEAFDVMSVTDAQGVSSDVYFNITRMRAKYLQMMEGFQQK
jgi:hypothetical protein